MFALRQLEALGLLARVVQQRAADGRLHRVHRGVYSLVPPDLLTGRGWYMAAVLACGPGAVLSHRSAAGLLGLRSTSRAGIDVSVPARRTRRHAGIDVHRSPTLTEADVTVVDGIRCTTVARTQLDLAAVVGDSQVASALNQAEALKVFDLWALQDQLRRNPHHPGGPRLRGALELYDDSGVPTESRIEHDFMELVRQAGLPLPEREVLFLLDDGEEPIRVDFAWRAQRLVLETDGRQWHGTRRAFEIDRRRDQRLTRAGWRVVRVTWRQLRDDPEGVIALLADLLAAQVA